MSDEIHFYAEAHMRMHSSQFFPFFSTGQPTHPQLFHDRACPTRGYAHRLRQNIYVLKCALSVLESKRIKMDRENTDLCE